jgi:GlpG protein
MLAPPEINFQRTPVTLILAATAAAIELVCTIDPDRRLVFYNTFRMGIYYPVFAGQIWRPFTTSLLHGDLLHAAFNIYWMVKFGTVIENRYGSYRTLGLITLLCYGAMLPQFVIATYTIPLGAAGRTVGLSGAMYGLFGFLWIARRRVPEFWEACDQRVVQVLLAWLVFCIVLTRLDFMSIANIAHFAGLVFGCLYALAVYAAKGRPAWMALAVTSTLVVLGTMFYCPGNPGWEFYHRRRPIRIRIVQVDPGRPLAVLDRAPAGRAPNVVEVAE